MPTPDDQYFAGRKSPEIGKPGWGYLAHRRLGVPEWVMVVIAIIGGLIVTPLLLLGIGLFVFAGVMPDTVYSKGYSESSFKSLKVGMTTQQVEAVMGSPLSKGTWYTPDQEMWQYSKQGSDEAVYYFRALYFKGGRLQAVQMELFYE
jgi:SmpA / OmlA family